MSQARSRANQWIGPGCPPASANSRRNAAIASSAGSAAGGDAAINVRTWAIEAEGASLLGRTGRAELIARECSLEKRSGLQRRQLFNNLARISRLRICPRQ